MMVSHRVPGAGGSQIAGRRRNDGATALVSNGGGRRFSLSPASGKSQPVRHSPATAENEVGTAEMDLARNGFAPFQLHGAIGGETFFICVIPRVPRAKLLAILP